MGKGAKKTSKSQVQPATIQRALKVAELVRWNPMTFVIREGMEALDELLEQDRVALCGPAHVKGARGEPVRWGSTDGRLVPGGQRVIVRKPRVRRDGKEVELPAQAELAEEDPLDERTFVLLHVVSADSGPRPGSSTRRSETSSSPSPLEGVA